MTCQSSHPPDGKSHGHSVSSHLSRRPALNRIAAGRPAAKALCVTCRKRLFTGKLAEVDEQELDRHRRNSDIPILLDVWAPWCGPCRTMAPEFAQAPLGLSQACASRS
jgi:thiol-disulfide isomerase/thioredoxin